MKRAVIVHGWDGYPEYAWYPYVKEQLEKRGFKVDVPFFPDSLPSLSRWTKKLVQAVGVPDEDTVLIGHSLGTVTILKYLQALPQGQRIGGVVLVAPFTDDLGYRALGNFFREPMDFAEIKKHSKAFAFIASDNDSYIKPYHAKLLGLTLGGEVIWTHKGHFTETNDKIQVSTLPEVVEAVERLTKKLKVMEVYDKSTKRNQGRI